MTIATRSMPIVWCTSMARATAIFVPTPSVDVASSGRRKRVNAEMSNRPGEAAEVADDLRALGGGHGGAHQGDGALAGLDVDAGRRVGGAGGAVGHGRSSASWAPPPMSVVTPSVSVPSTTRRSMPSSTCLPSSSGSGSATG